MLIQRGRDHIYNDRSLLYPSINSMWHCIQDATNLHAEVLPSSCCDGVWTLGQKVASMGQK